MTQTAQDFATKLAFVPDPPTAAKQPSLSKIPTTPGIGEKKTPRPSSPAALGARKASMGQRGGLATQTPQQSALSASKAMRPSSIKTAEEVGKSLGTVTKRKIKKAPRHSMSGKRGKKVMPLPHARRTKKAYQLMNNSCEFIGTIDSDRVHDGMTTAHAIGGYLAPTTDLEKIAKWNYIQRAEREKRAASFAVELLREKQALGGFGTLVGAIGGTASAPKGSRMEGLGRGVGQGLGWDTGGSLGAAGGGGIGAAGGGALAALIAKLSGVSNGPDLGAAVGAGAGLGGLVGGIGGYFGGGMLGRSAAKGMMGKPNYEKQQPQRAQTEDNSVGDADADAAQMTAP